MDQITSAIDEEFVIANEISTFLHCFEESNGKWCCMVAGCKSSLANKSAAIKHLRRAHSQIYDLIDAQKSMQTNQSTEVRITETPARIRHAILQLVVFCALPFSTVQQWGFQLLIKPYVTAFRKVNANFAVNRTSLRSQIQVQAEQIKKDIIQEVNRKMVCLLLDIASRYNRSVLGISIVYYSNGTVHTRTIGMITLKIFV